MNEQISGDDPKDSIPVGRAVDPDATTPKVERSFETGIEGFVIESASIPGSKHTEMTNEDGIVLNTKHDLSVLFDGMGACQGFRAKEIAVATTERFCEENDPVETEEGAIRFVRALFSVIQEDIASQEEGRETVESIGTAVVAFKSFVEDGVHKVAVAGVGDSRAYLKKEGVDAVQLTKDDGQNRKLSRALGVFRGGDPGAEWTQLALPDENLVDVIIIPIEPGDTLLLASDGVYEVFAKNPGEMFEIESDLAQVAVSRSPAYFGDDYIDDASFVKAHAGEIQQ